MRSPFPVSSWRSCLCLADLRERIGSQSTSPVRDNDTVDGDIGMKGSLEYIAAGHEPVILAGISLTG